MNPLTIIALTHWIGALLGFAPFAVIGATVWSLGGRWSAGAIFALALLMGYLLGWSEPVRCACCGRMS